MLSDHLAIVLAAGVLQPKCGAVLRLQPGQRRRGRGGRLPAGTHARHGGAL